MQNKIMQLLKRSSLLLITMTTVVGCASNEKVTNTHWPSYARDAADRRLATRDIYISDQQSTITKSSDLNPGTCSGTYNQSHQPDFLLLSEYSTNESAPVKQGQIKPGSIDRGPLPGFFETVKRDLKEMPCVLWEDTKSVYTDPFNLIFLV
ncbi:MAG: hypothetical protein JSV03_05385, partial [Planctomycetota bacterium]